MRRLLTALTLALALAFPACAPPQPARRPPVPKGAIQVEQRGTWLRVLVHVQSGPQPVTPQPRPTHWSFSYKGVDGRVLALGLAFQGGSAPIFAMVPGARTVADRNEALAYGITFAAMGTLCVVLAFIIPGLREHQEPIDDALWMAGLAYPRHVIELRPPSIPPVLLGQTDAAGALVVELSEFRPPGFGGATTAPIYLDGRQVGTAALVEAVRLQEAREWARVDVPACQAGLEAACAAVKEHLGRFPAGPHAGALRELLARRAPPPPPTCPAECEKRCRGAADCARACRERWCR